MAQEAEIKGNPYTVCIVYDKQNREPEAFVKEFAKVAKSAEDFIYLKTCHRDVERGRDQSYITVVKKYINDTYGNDEKYKTESGIVIRRLFPDNKPIGNNMTWGFFIKTEDHNPQSVVNIFSNFESQGFLNKDSYNVLFPRDYPDGTPRKYLIVTFNKQNDSLPKKFIRKLKTLLHNSTLEGKTLKVNWLSNSVKKDILHGENKDIKKKEQ